MELAQREPAALRSASTACASSTPPHGSALFSPPIEGIARLQAEIGLVVPVEPEQLRWKTDPLSLSRCLEKSPFGLEVRAALGARDPHGLTSRFESGVGRGERRRGFERKVDQLIEGRIAILLPPVAAGQAPTPPGASESGAACISDSGLDLGGSPAHAAHAAAADMQLIPRIDEWPRREQCRSHKKPRST